MKAPASAAAQRAGQEARAWPLSVQFAAQPAAPSAWLAPLEVDCGPVPATDEEWHRVRACAVQAAANAAYLGYAEAAVGDWFVAAQRRRLAGHPDGQALVGMCLVHQHHVLRRWTTSVAVEDLR